MHNKIICGYTAPLNPENNIDRRKNDGYERLLGDIRDSFEHAINGGSEPLFTTNVCGTNLYDIFLSAIPPHARQHYNCRTCRKFVNTYGGLVTIDENGKTTPVMWDIAYEGFFEQAVRAVRERVKKAGVTGVFITSDRRLGVARTGIWEHMCVDIPSNVVYRTGVKDADQVMAEKREEYKMLLTACERYSIDEAKCARHYLSDVSFARAEKFKHWADWFINVKKEFNSRARHDARRTNRLWLDVANAPVGYCHISSGVLGSLIEDIRDGLSYDTVKARYNAKVDPLKYMRPQVNPAVGNVARAEEIVKKLGIENSLKRRFARLDELNPVWHTKIHRFGGVMISGPFKGIPVKTTETIERLPKGEHIDGGYITWEKFRRNILGQADNIEYLIDGADNFCALTTAVDPEAPPILKWDTKESRCPFAWYMYATGSMPYRWNIKGYKVWHKVTAIDVLPPVRRGMRDQFGQGVIFILDDCKDVNYDNAGNALFPECLRSELYEVRSTIEAYSKQTHLEGYDEASACGVCFTDHRQNWDCHVRVTLSDGRRVKYHIDRWD